MQMIDIVKSMVNKMGSATYTNDAIIAIAKRSKNVPRIAGNLIFQVNDAAIAHNIGVVTDGLVKEVMDRNGITDDGLDSTDRKIIETLQEHETLGLETLSTFVGEDSMWISKVYEPFLMQRGYITRGARGRSLTEKGRGVKF